MQYSVSMNAKAKKSLSNQLDLPVHVFTNGRPVTVRVTDMLYQIPLWNNIAISMDGKGRWMDNVFIERLWKSVKSEAIYLKSYGSMTETRIGLSEYFQFIGAETGR